MGRGPRGRVAARLGFSERSLYRFLHEVDEVDEVDIDVMDQTLCNAWTSPMLSDLYPDLYDNA
jgi:hypothetical protein